MRIRSILTVLLAGAACLLLAGCQANDEVIPETTFRSLLKLVASDTADNTSFGMSVAVDGAYALVGAPGDDVNWTNSGAAYLFLQSQGGLDGWGQVKKLVAPPSLRFIAGELARIGSGAEMPGFVWVEPGRGGERLIVFRLSDFAERHGIPEVE